MKCIKAVVNINCRYCCGKLIRFGKTKSCQRYRCKDCNKTQLHEYVRHVYHLSTDNNIATFVKEGFKMSHIYWCFSSIN
jgi:transposase-like protein